MPLTHMNFKEIEELKCKKKTVKLSEENIAKKLCNIMRVRFSNKTKKHKPK